MSKLSKDFIVIQALKKIYSLSAVPVFQDLSFHLSLGTSLSIQGKSGCGKSTLLYILGLLDKPTEGQYLLDNINISTLTQTQKAKLRNQYFGFIFQNHQLIPYLSALENIRLPYCYRQDKIDLNWEKNLLTKLEINALTNRYPHELSLGQQQRVAIARALITQPKVIFADEPTASLDSDLADIFMKMLLDYVQEKQALYIMVTHDKNLAKQTERQLYL